MVKTDLHIRRATTADASLLSSLSEITFFDTFKDTCTHEDMLGFIKDNFSVGQLEKELQDDDDYYFIAFVNEIPVAYLRIKEDVSGVEIIKRHKAIELKRIYVLKEYHLQKIGAALMNFALNFATENNYELIWLGVWEFNERAKAFYEKFGFIDSGATHPFPIGNTPQTDKWLYRIIKK